MSEKKSATATSSTKVSFRKSSYPHKAHGKTPARLFVKGAFVGYKRSLSNQYNHTALIAIDGVKSAKETAFYQGKRVAYIYHAKRLVSGSHFRVIWGRLARPHGNNGVMRAKFRSNLPPKALGATVRVFLYPSRI